jgi:hypothetical protein
LVDELEDNVSELLEDKDPESLEDKVLELFVHADKIMPNKTPILTF